MMGFRTKIVEGVGAKLKKLLPNSKCKRAGCGRDGCIPCSQPGDVKQDCRKCSFVYDKKGGGGCAYPVQGQNFK